MSVDMLRTQWRIMSCTRRVKEHAERLMVPFCNEYDLTSSQLRVLVCLVFEGPTTASRLAKAACMAEGNHSNVCKQLVKAGLIERRRCEADERQVEIRLSQKGEALMEQLAQRWRQSAGEFEVKIPDEELARMLEDMERIVLALDDG